MAQLGGEPEPPSADKRASAPAGSPTLSATGQVPADRRGRVSWALFDWANQPYFTVVTLFIFAPYFAAGFIGDPVRGQELWGYTQSMAGLVIALVSPMLGAVADAKGRRKPWLAGFSALFAISASLLWFALPGAPSGPAVIMAAVVLAAIGMEFAVVFNNAMLPSLVPEARMGRLSGFAWGLGYVGGLVALMLVLLFLVADRETGETLIGLAPWFGLDPAAYEADRLTGPLSVLWYAVFVLPLFLFTPDAPATGLSIRQATAQGLRTLAGTFAKLRRYRNVALFLVARMTYHDGLSAIFAFGGIYAAGTFGWTIETLAIFGIVLSVFAAVGAFVGGWLDDRLGSKPTVLIAVGGLVLGTLLSASVTRDTVLYVISVAPRAPDAPAFSTVGEQIYLAFGILIGICGGPAQAASRTLMARLAPPHMTTEFFGLYALSGKATAFVAPFAVAVMTAAFDSQRAGLLVIVAFLVVGFVLLFGVREARAPDI